MTRRLSSLLAAALLTCGLGLSSPADAQSRPMTPPGSVSQAAPVRAKVDVEVRVVYATSAHSRVDSRLSGLTRYLSHLRFTGYELLDTQKAQVALGGKASFTVEGGRKVTVTLLGRDESRARVRVQVSGSNDKQLLDTTMSVNRDGTVIVAGPKHQDGILVLPLTARY
ncbi:hypothetical protein L6R53_17715 [Myxococcota bacterium]|nr:hypothetical protein [Myxococcota bacterium]